MNWLDRSIGWVAPTWGAKRLRSRVIASALLAYEGARSGRRTLGWNTPNGAAPDVEVMAFAGLMRNRARDLVRNDPHASKAVQVVVSNKVGSGITAQPAGPNKRRNERLNERWQRWVDNADYQRRLDLYGIQSLAERTRVESGEALVRFIPTGVNGPMDVPFRLVVLEPDYIDDTRNEQLSDLRYIKHGVEYDDGIPVAYWLYETHPGDDFNARRMRRGFQSARVPASEVIHYFKPLRAGQSRGMTDFAPVMLRLRALSDYDDAEVMRKKIAACFAAFVTTPGEPPFGSVLPTTLDSETGDRLEMFRPGVVTYLKPGENVVTADPKPSSDYAPFNSVQLHAIAAGLGIPYELLTNDLSEINYSSLRGGLVQFRGAIEADQWQITIPQLCRPICDRFTREAARVDSMIEAGTPWVYTPPRFGLLDPAKEVPAMVEAIRAGIESYPNAIRRDGYDWKEKLAEIREAQDEMDRLGITITADARVQQKGGTAAAETPQPGQVEPPR